MRWLVAMSALAACGRIGFSARAAGDAPPSDSPADAPHDVADARPPMLVQVVAPGYQKAASVAETVDATAGDLLVAAAYWDQSPDSVTLTDSAGLAWTALPDLVATTGCGGTTGNATGARLAYARVPASGSLTLTLTQTSGTQPLGLFVLEYAGIDTADPVDTMTSQVAPAGSNAFEVPTLTTASQSVVVAFFNDTIGQGTCSGGAGFTVEAHDDGFPNLLEDAIEPPGAYTPGGTLPAGEADACWVGAAIALRAL